MKEISKAVALAQRTQVAVPAHMAPALVRRDPDTNLALAISRLHELGCDAFVKKGMVFPTNPKTGEMTWREVVRGTELVLGKRNDLPACAREVAALLAPAHMDSIEGWLTEVSAITARRSETEEEGALTLVAYSSRLAQYPGDIVRQTLLEWSGKWFPTWGELKEILDARTAPRLSIHDELRRLLQPEPKVSAVDLTAMKRELALLEDGNIPYELRFADRSEQIEWIDARILTLKTDLAKHQGQGA